MSSPTTVYHLFALALLFAFVFASDQCFTQDNFEETIKEMDEKAQKMHLYKGVAHCFEERVQNLPPRRKYWNNDEDDQVKCYERDTLDAKLERCAKESGDYDKGEIDDEEGEVNDDKQEIDGSSRFYPDTGRQPKKASSLPRSTRKGTRASTRLDTIVVRGARCTEAHFCCLWPNATMGQRTHCLGRSKCGNPNICRQRR